MLARLQLAESARANWPSHSRPMDGCVLHVRPLNYRWTRLHTAIAPVPRPDNVQQGLRQRRAQGQAMTKPISVQLPPKRQLYQVRHSNAAKAASCAWLSALNVIHPLDSYLLDKVQQPRIVGAEVLDSMAVVRHDETAAQAKEHLTTQVSRCISGAELGKIAV